MQDKVRVFELRNTEGQVLFNFYLYEKPLSSDSPQGGENESTSNKQGSKGKNPYPSNGDSMTQAQKRFLFRILAEQGKEEDKAYQYLKERFQVDNLQKVTKFAASQLIESLLAEQKEGD